MREIAAGRVTPGRVAARTRERIEALELDVRAWVHLDPEVRATASGPSDRVPLDPEFGAAASGPLAGVPLGVKDLIDVAGMPTRCGSTLRSSRPVERDADCVKLARRLGAVPIGKTVTTEFGYFAPGPTRNPHALDHTPGGSSSGSAAAVAAGMVPLAFGTQTAGSLTRPASFCGVAGLVTARGRFSTTGITGLSPSLDSLGVLARTVDDLHYGWAAMDSGIAPAELVPSSPRRLEVWSGFELGEVSPSMTAALRATADAAADAGTTCRELDSSARIVALAEQHATVMAYEAVRERAAEARHTDEISAPLAELFATGRRIPEAAYRAALAEIDAAQRRLLAMLDQNEFVLGPAALGAAPRGLDATGTPILSRPWQAMGLPVVTIPGHRDESGLPLGLQLIGRPGDEQALLQAAAWLEAHLHP
ncbi:MAG TPA: amidase [Aldersonia sp.]